MSADFFAAAVSMTLGGSSALLVVLALRVCVRRGFGAQVAYAIWLAVPLIAAATLLPAPAIPTRNALNLVRDGEALAVVAAANVPMDLRAVLLAIWLLGALLMLAWFAMQQRWFLRQLGRLHALDGAGDRILRSESRIVGPVVVGVWRPRIVLPVDFETNYTPRERELILAHEGVHLARGDARINAFAVALRCLNWFNPLLHYAAAKFRLDQELACDAAVLSRFPAARRPYADAMLKTQLAGQSQRALHLPVGCRWPDGHPLKERIAMLKKPLPTQARRTVGVILLALAGLGGGYVAWAEQMPGSASTAMHSGAYVEARIKLSVDGGAEQSLRQVVPVGQPFSLASADAVAAWQAEFTARPLADGNIELASTIRRDGKVISAPEIVVRPGDAAALDVGKPGELSFVHMEATLFFRDAIGKEDREPVGDAMTR